MTKKTNLIFYRLFGLIVLMALALTVFNCGNEIINEGLHILALFGLIYLIANGTIMETVYWKILIFCFALTLIGALFKIMHWRYSDNLLTSGLLSIPLTYLFRFIAKKQKNRPDILKLIWVFTYFTITLLVIKHYISRDYLLLNSVILWLTIIDILIIKYKIIAGGK